MFERLIRVVAAAARHHSASGRLAEVVRRFLQQEGVESDQEFFDPWPMLAGMAQGTCVAGAIVDFSFVEEEFEGESLVNTAIARRAAVAAAVHDARLLALPVLDAESSGSEVQMERNIVIKCGMKFRVRNPYLLKVLGIARDDRREGRGWRICEMKGRIFSNIGCHISEDELSENITSGKYIPLDEDEDNRS